MVFSSGLRKLKIVLASIISIICVVVLSGCSFLFDFINFEYDYCKSSNWDCETNQDFFERYVPLYERRINKVEEYGLQYTIQTKISEEYGWVEYTLFDDNNTLIFRFDNEPGFGMIKVNFYYFSENEDDLKEYSEISNTVAFIYYIMKNVCFDLKGNEKTFEDLFNEALSEESKSSSYIYHFDNYCGNVGYWVDLYRDQDEYYNKSQSLNKDNLKSNQLSFEGLLRPKSKDYSEGVDAKLYNPNISSVGITDSLIPENFLDMYEFSGGKFYYYSDYYGFFGLEASENALLYLEYSEENYQTVKEYLLNQMGLDFTSEKTYNDYIFYIYPSRRYSYDFPYRYSLAGYNDEKQTLVFIGSICEKKNYPEVEYGLTDFGLYLKTFFGEWYDFDA